MALGMTQVHGLGQAEIVAAILGPVVTGGADVYRTYEESRLSKKELKQRQREFEAMSKLQQEQLKSAERSRIIQQQLELQREAQRRAWLQQNLPLIVGGTVLVALALAAARRR